MHASDINNFHLVSWDTSDIVKRMIVFFSVYLNNMSYCKTAAENLSTPELQEECDIQGLKHYRTRKKLINNYKDTKTYLYHTLFICIMLAG